MSARARDTLRRLAGETRTTSTFHANGTHPDFTACGEPLRFKDRILRTKILPAEVTCGRCRVAKKTLVKVLVEERRKMKARGHA